MSGWHSVGSKAGLMSKAFILCKHLRHSAQGSVLTVQEPYPFVSYHPAAACALAPQQKLPLGTLDRTHTALHSTRPTLHSIRPALHSTRPTLHCARLHVRACFTSSLRGCSSLCAPRRALVPAQGCTALHRGHTAFCSATPALHCARVKLHEESVCPSA